MKFFCGVQGINRIDHKIRSNSVIIRFIGCTQFNFASCISKHIKGGNLESDEGWDRAWFKAVGQL